METTRFTFTVAGSRKGEFLIGETISHYRIVAKIGAGGMGEVYSAHDPRLDRQVAVKVLPSTALDDPTRLSRFEREARSTGALNHPNIVAIYDVGQHEGIPYIVTELLEGGTLRQRLRDRDLTVRRAVEYGIQIAEGLAAAHSKDIIHRDLKPENIFVTADGHVKILDFGLAKLRQPVSGPAASEQVTEAVETEAGAIVGTLGYMSPEQLHGKPADHRSDIFAFGALMYEMMAGRRAFAGDSKANIVAAILRDEPPAISDFSRPIPTQLEQLIRRCLSKRPEDRFESAHDVGLALRSIQETADWSTTTLRLPKLRSWKRAATVVAAALLLAVIALVIWLGNRRGDPGGGVTEQPSTRPPAIGQLPDMKRLVVVPFKAAGGDENDAVLAVGLSENISDCLEVLEVQTHGSFWAVAPGSFRSLEHARRDLGVNLAVTGTWEVADGGLHIETGAVMEDGLRPLASERVEGPGGELADFQVEPALRIAEMLGLEVTGDSLAVLDAKTTPVERAFTEYIRGIGLLAGDVNEEVLAAAVAALERSTNEDPNFLSARVALVGALQRTYMETRQQSWLDRAEVQARIARDQDPNSASAYRILAAVQRTGGRVDDAVTTLEAGVRAAPDNARIHHALGVVLREAGRPVEAERALQRAINFRPGYAPTHAVLGYLYFVTNRYDAAANQFREVVEGAPLRVDGYNNLGGMLYLLDRRVEARTAFEQSVEAQPNAVAFSQLGTMAFDEGDFDRAVDMFERAIELDRRDWEFAGNLAHAYHWGGRRSEGAAAYRNAIEMCEARLEETPGDPWLMANLAGYHGMVGQREAGLELLDRVIQGDMVDAQLMSAIAESFEDLGERDRALHWLERALNDGQSMDWVEQAPSLADLRTDPRYQQLIRKVDN